ncbi:ras-associating and dilute domain-containing protein-like protein [Lates japonicus]|uniref:Ras-associating and dilute domain-containing protein-like protein n=1 Tax=Lates japonicus TaxID=270547 RepID=A0AAD3NF89_LATJO|nr:ras-associating and dilute domain-containing protein-like protein [Lates japonicus]
MSALREDPEAEADKEVLRLGMEKEETESSDDNTTQYSIHPPFDFPYFLLLQGYSHRQDFVIYLMSGTTTIFGCCREHCNGEDEERLKVDILLFAPDVLPQHCCVRRLDSQNQTSTGEHRKTLTMLKPLHGAPVTRNGFLLKEEVELNPGDLVGLGKHYLFMFKDPTSTSGSLETPPWMTRLCPNSDTKPSSSCLSCGSSIGAKRPHRKPPCWRDLEGMEASLSYELEQEKKVLRQILDSADPSGNEPKLTPAFLLSLCVLRSASTFELTHFRQLLLRIASQIQLVMWEKTKELAAIQPETSSGESQPDQLHLLSMDELIPGLQPLVLWMANSIELLHFIQHEVPQLLPWRQDQEDEGLLDSEISATRTACEEAMTVLEEVIMFTFQQSVYYLTKLKSVMEQVLDFAVRELTKIVEASFDDLLLEITKMEREQQLLEEKLGKTSDRGGGEKGRGGGGGEKGRGGGGGEKGRGGGGGGRRRGSENDSVSPSGSEDAREELGEVTVSKETTETEGE